LQRLRGGDALMNVVAQFQFFRQLLATLFEELQRASNVRRGLKHGSRVQGLD
jgi:hypothetical protein